MNELWIDDIIGEDFFGEGVSAKVVRNQLKGMDSNERVTVRINSPGGSVFDAVAIRSLLAEWPGGVDVRIDGLAASAASYIATIGETVTAAEGAFVMIHNPWSMVAGDAAAMRSEADLLDKVAGQLAAAYAAKTGTADAVWSKIMAEETWYDADEALEAGLVDVIAGRAPAKDKEKAAASAKRRLSATAMRNRLALTVQKFQGRINR